MNNVLLDELPEEWNGYKINTSFRIGIQIFLVQEDKILADYERIPLIISLLFEQDGEDTVSFPEGEELGKCIRWFMNGWCHDKYPVDVDKRRIIDFDIDQWRIYADFRQIYGINLNEVDMHWWEFMGMLWNMPHRQSSFLQVIEIRKEKINAKMSKEEKDAIKKAHHVYGLENSGGSKKREYTDEEKQKMDDVDLIREKMRANKKEQKEATSIFHTQI